MREEVICFGEDSLKVGVFTHAIESVFSQQYCALFLNAGMVHKIGPNRLYVHMARSLSPLGVHSFRFDFSGLGDSENSSLTDSYEVIQIAEVSEAMDAIQQKTGIDKFLLVGICSGAEIAFQVAIRQDSRIVGVSLIDGVYSPKHQLQEIYPKAGRTTAIRYYKKNLFNLRRWLKVFRGKSGLFQLKNIGVVLQLVLSQIKSSGDQRAQPSPVRNSEERVFAIDEWQVLFDQKIKTQLIFCEGDLAIDVFKLTIGRKLQNYVDDELLTLHYLKDIDHTFTPHWSQQLLIEMVSAWISRHWCHTNQDADPNFLSVSAIAE